MSSTNLSCRRKKIPLTHFLVFVGAVLKTHKFQTKFRLKMRKRSKIRTHQNHKVIYVLKLLNVHWKQLSFDPFHEFSSFNSHFKNYAKVDMVDIYICIMQVWLCISRCFLPLIYLYSKYGTCMMWVWCMDDIIMSICDVSMVYAWYKYDV